MIVNMALDNSVVEVMGAAFVGFVLFPITFICAFIFFNKVP